MHLALPIPTLFLAGALKPTSSHGKPDARQTLTVPSGCCSAPGPRGSESASAGTFDASSSEGAGTRPAPRWQLQCFWSKRLGMSGPGPRARPRPECVPVHRSRHALGLTDIMLERSFGRGSLWLHRYLREKPARLGVQIAAPVMLPHVSKYPTGVQARRDARKPG